MIGYLGPRGTFTEAAAREWARRTNRGEALVPLDQVPQVCAASANRGNFGVVPIENTIEGYVTPTLDLLLAAAEVAAVGEVVLPISFDAFVRPGVPTAQLRELVAHPHALAQVRKFSAAQHLTPVPTTSNAAACRDLAAHQVAVGAPACGAEYALETWQRDVGDYRGARTRFLVLAPRSNASQLLAEQAASTRAGPPESQTGFRTLLAITPSAVGPGVLARITAAVGQRQVNMSSLITRPLKARAGQYVFVVTLDAAPWEPAVRALLADLLAAGDALKTIGAYPGDPGGASLDAVLANTRPTGSVTGSATAAQLAEGLLW